MLSPETSPYLAERQGDDIVTASGTTLLGADDKAGVAIVMTLARHLLAHPEIAHGPIRIAFTPDEEIGRGVHADLPRDLAADVAYTLDGAERGEIVFESFSADKAVVRIEGVSIHPGVAKGKLVNALHLAAKIVDTLPHATLTPETTSGREGFLHVYQMSGTAAAAELSIILRDFERDALAAHGALVEKVCAAVQAGEPRAKITCAITPQYRNMRYWLEKDMRPVELAREACRQTGLAPFSAPVRGGTDGSRLTEMGVPMPQSLHRHAGNPRPPRVGLDRRHGRLRRHVPEARRALGRRAQALTAAERQSGHEDIGARHAERVGSRIVLVAVGVDVVVAGFDSRIHDAGVSTDEVIIARDRVLTRVEEI